MYADDTTIYFKLEEFDYLNKKRDINCELVKANMMLICFYCKAEINSTALEDS